MIVAMSLVVIEGDRRLPVWIVQEDPGVRWARRCIGRS